MEQVDNAKQQRGVSASFFCDAIKSLSRIHGSVMTGPWIEEFRASLELAERLYLSGEPVVKPKRSVKKAGD